MSTSPSFAAAAAAAVVLVAGVEVAMVSGTVDGDEVDEDAGKDDDDDSTDRCRDLPNEVIST